MAALSARLTGRQLTAGLDALHEIGEGCSGASAYAGRGVSALARLIGAELTTLSVCDLTHNHRHVVSDRPGAISTTELQAFDRHFRDHPLVRDHARNPRAVTRRISDLLPQREFHETALYNDYYRRIGIGHAMAIPVHVDADLLVSFVLNRATVPFAKGERDLAEAIRPHLSDLYRLAGEALPPAVAALLTQREREVLTWVAAGKSNGDIGDILGARPRTVEKHLERIYQKLGVESRTAAARRALKG